MFFFVFTYNASARPADDENRSLQIDDASLDAIIHNINQKKRAERERERASRNEEVEQRVSDGSAEGSTPVYNVVPRSRPRYFDYRRQQEYLDLLTNRSIDETKNHSCVRQFISENPGVNLTETEVFKFFSLCPLSDAYQPPVAPNPQDPASRRLTYEPTSFCDCVNEKKMQSDNSTLGPYRPLTSRGLAEKGKDIQDLIISLNVEKLASEYQEFAENYAYIKNSPEFHSLYTRPKGDTVEPNSLVRCDPDELAALPSHLAAENVCSIETADTILDNLVPTSNTEEVISAGPMARIPAGREGLRKTADIFRSSLRTRGTNSSRLPTIREALDRGNRLAPANACRVYEAATNGEACAVNRTEGAGASGSENMNSLNQATQDELFRARVQMTETLTGVLDHLHKNNGRLENYDMPEGSINKIKMIVMTNPFLRREFFPNKKIEEVKTEEIVAKMSEHLMKTIYPALQEIIKLAPDKKIPEKIDLNLTLQALTLINYPDYVESLRGCRKIIRRISNLCEAIDKGNQDREEPQITPFLQNAELMRPLIEASNGEDADGLIQTIVTDSSQVACSEYGRAKMQNRGRIPVFVSTSDRVVDSLTAVIRTEEGRLRERRPEDHATANITRNMFDRVAGGERPPTVSRSDSLVAEDARREIDRHRTEQLATTQRANADERARKIAELSGDNSRASSQTLSGSGVVKTDDVVYSSNMASIERPAEGALFSAAQVKAGQSTSSRIREEMTAEEIAKLSPHEKRLLDELDRLSAREAKLEEDLRRSEKEREEIRNKARLEEQDRLIASLKDELKSLKTEMASLSKNLSPPAKAAAEKIAGATTTPAKISNDPFRSGSKLGGSETSSGNLGNSSGQVTSGTGQSLPVGGGIRTTVATPLIPTRGAGNSGITSGGVSPLILTNRLNSSDASISQLAAESQNAVVYRQTNMAGFVEKIVFKTVDGRVLFENGEPIIEETQLIAMEETEIQAWLARMNQSSDGRFPASITESPELIELERRSTPSARHNNLIEEIQKQRELIGTEN